MLDLVRPKIEIRGVSKTYASDHGPVLALRGTDLTVNEGEFVSIVGPSGCGKSTLLYVVGGFLAADGEVAVDGAPIKGPGTDRGIVFQEYALFPWLTVHDNIAFGLERQGLAASEREKIVSRLVGVIGLAGFEKRYPRELSGGMKQRVAIARTLRAISDPVARRALRRTRCPDPGNNAGRTAADLAGISRPSSWSPTTSLRQSISRIGFASCRPDPVRSSRNSPVSLDRGRSREELAVSEQFNSIRNRVWLSVRRQALAAGERNDES